MGSGAAQARVLAVLRELGTDKEGRPLALRAAELAERAKVNHHSLTKCTAPLLEIGQITRCMVQPMKGNKTFEFRIGTGMVAPEFHALDAKRAGIATGGHRSSRPLPPIPKTRPAPVGAVVKSVKTASPAGGDATMLRNVQGMSESEFRDYIGHLARVWSWGRAQALAADVFKGAA